MAASSGGSLPDTPKARRQRSQQKQFGAISGRSKMFVREVVRAMHQTHEFPSSGPGERPHLILMKAFMNRPAEASNLAFSTALKVDRVPSPDLGRPAHDTAPCQRHPPAQPSRRFAGLGVQSRQRTWSRCCLLAIAERPRHRRLASAERPHH